MSDEPAPNRFVSPRQLAKAAGVSESSIKRWCDQGLIPTVKTAGGHRRLTLDAAAEYLRQAHPDAHPELLGLPPRTHLEEHSVGATIAELYHRLVAGDDAACRAILFDLHLSGERVSRIADAVISPAFQSVGSGWECGDVEIYQERRACRIVLRILEELKTVVPAAKRSAPLAIGGTPECDPYMLPTALVELTMQQSGWRSQSLGSRLPFNTLAAAIRDQQPRLFWLSISHVTDERQFLAQYREFYSAVQNDVAVVVGGRALTDSYRRNMEYAAFCDNLQHLEAFARTIKRSLSASS